MNIYLDIKIAYIVLYLEILLRNILHLKAARWNFYSKK